MEPLILFPAIDLKQGQCVRLYKGDMEQATIFNQSPAEQAQIFEQQGFSWLHLVDLDGAFAGESVNKQAIHTIRQAISLPIQLGGGIRTIEHIESWLTAGINRVILGTVAVNNPELVKQACKLFPKQIVVGIDARDGMVAVEGWAEQSTLSAIELGKRFEDAGVEAIIYTDIERDGALSGVNIPQTAHLAENLSIPVIASGGLHHLDDIRALKQEQHKGIVGVISGKALYEKKILPDEALALCQEG
jgi:phosphoribosylformimino-5-aminoimidazole carboxamide ribotide isomerase